MTTTPSLHAQPLLERLRQQYPDTPHHRDGLHREAADEIERMTADRDSWAQQASDRVDDAVRFAQERDEAIRERDTIRAELAALKSAAPVDSMDYSFCCFSCANEWECKSPDANCPACGTTNSFCAENASTLAAAKGTP